MSTENELVTRGFLAASLEGAGLGIAKAIKHALAPFTSRLSAVETRTGALSMLFGKGTDAKRIADLDALLTRAAAHEDGRANEVQRDLLAVVDSLTRRLEALEARPALKYVGIYRDGVHYEENSLATHAGSMWLARRTTATRPGSDPESWLLVVKKGDHHAAQ